MPFPDFLQGFNDAKQRNQAADTANIAQFGSLQKILAQQQAQQKAQQFQAEIAQAQTPEQRLAIAQKFMGANQLGTSLQGAQNTAATRDATAAQREATNEFSRARIEETRFGREQRASDAAASRDQRDKEIKLRLQDAAIGRQERGDLLRELQKSRAESAKALKEAATIEKPLNQFQGKSMLYGTRAAQSDKILKSLEDTVNLSTLSASESFGSVGNFFLSSEQQRVKQAQRDFVNAVLRQESGAVINPDEFDNAKKQYFPSPGDAQATKDQKRANRELAIKGFARMSGSEGAAAINEIVTSPLMPGVSATSKPDVERKSIIDQANDILLRGR